MREKVLQEMGNIDKLSDINRLSSVYWNNTLNIFCLYKKYTDVVAGRIIDNSNKEE